MRFLRMISLALIFAATPALLASETGKQPSESQEGRINRKATEKAIAKVSNKLAKAKEKFEAKLAELQDKLEKETDEDKQEGLREKIKEFQIEFATHENRLSEILSTLEILPIINPTRSTTSHLIRGNCGNVLAWPPLDDRREVVKSLKMPPDYCYEYRGGTLSIRINDAGPSLQASACFTSMGGQNSNSGTYTFYAPGITVMRFCNVKGSACKVLVFMEDMSTLYSMALSNSGRDNALASICPPYGQSKYPVHGHWRLLPLETSMVAGREWVIAGIIGGMGGVSRTNLGLGGLNVLKEGMKVDPFAERNIVLDAQILDLVEPVDELWLKINEYFVPLIAPTYAELKDVNFLREEIGKLLDGELSPSAMPKVDSLAAVAEDGLSRHGEEEFKKFAEELRKAHDELSKNGEKKAKKILKKLAKRLDKKRKALEKELKPIVEPRQAVIDAIKQKEFVVAGKRMGRMVKSHPDRSRHELLQSKVDVYKKVARVLQNHLEKVKTELVRRLDKERFAEPTLVKAGEALSIFGSHTGGEIDFEIHPRLKAIYGSEFIPAGPDGMVDKNTPLMKDWKPVLFATDELLENGFVTATLEFKNGQPIVSRVKRGDGVELFLHRYTDREGVTEIEIPLVKLRDDHGVRWLAALFTNEGKTVIPKDDREFLTTFNFLDRDSHALTVSWFTFSTGGFIKFRKGDTNEEVAKLKLKYVMAPGVYKLQLVIVDALQKDPMKRALIFSAVYFRILPPKIDFAETQSK